MKSSWSCARASAVESRGSWVSGDARRHRHRQALRPRRRHRPLLLRVAARALRDRASVASRPRNQYLLYSLLDEAAGEAPELLRQLGDRFEWTGRRSPERGEVDLFHCTAHAVPLLPEWRLLFSLYDLTFLTHPHLHTFDNRLHCTTGLARALARGAKLAAISEHTRRDAVRVLGLEASTVAVVPPGLDDRFVAPGPVEVKALAARLGLGPYLLHVGVEEPRKNTAALVEAYRRLPAELRVATCSCSRATAAGAIRHSPRIRRAMRRARCAGWAPCPTKNYPRSTPGFALRVPFAVRGIRAAAARGHGVRSAGAGVEHRVAARGGRRSGGSL